MPRYFVVTTVHMEVETYVDAESEEEAIEAAEFDLDITRHDYTTHSVADEADEGEDEDEDE